MNKLKFLSLLSLLCSVLLATPIPVDVANIEGKVQLGLTALAMGAALGIAWIKLSMRAERGELREYLAKEIKQALAACSKENSKFISRAECLLLETKSDESLKIAREERIKIQEGVNRLREDVVRLQSQFERHGEQLAVFTIQLAELMKHSKNRKNREIR